ncbi:MAG: sulfite exporter TauE/SafE family protein [Rhodospirillaceae bacterium]|nr:MAG: sulfite exporter TauE/SafE family protein [Rhodospirillaceae bacterium]
MQIYLPIAEMSVNIFLVLALGGGIGLLSGLFGVGGGFMMTPLLIFIGVPPAVAVGTQANQIVASSVSGVLVHMRRGNVDLKMGAVLTIGGFVGSSLGVWVFNVLKRLGHIDVTIAFGYVVFLGIVGGFMLYESLPGVLNKGAPMPLTARGPGRHTWMHGLPFKMRFRRSKLYISALLPLAVGFVVGILGAVMGVGGGFIMVPAMIYLLGMPTQVVIGTSLLQTIFVAANTTLLQAIFNQTVDVVLALLLLVVGVVGAQVGARLAGKFKGEQLRVMLAIMVLAVALRLALDLVIPPQDLFSLRESGG